MINGALRSTRPSRPTDAVAARHYFLWLIPFFCVQILLVVSVRADPSRTMALTIDDLPYQSSGYEDSIERVRYVTEGFINTLNKHNAPAIGFVNEANLAITGEAALRKQLLTKWASAGVVLGNHTYSHADLNTVTVEEYKRQIKDGERVTLEIMSSQGSYQRYFRHPYTHTGNTEAKKTSINAYLAELGYEIAPYTIASQDSLFNRVYLDALSAGDSELAETLRIAFLDFVLRTTTFAEGKSEELFGAGIPQTLILHANRITADTLSDLLTRLQARGYSFIDLSTAMKHPAYKTDDTLVTRYGPSWLWRWNKSLGAGISFRGDPEPPAWIVTRYEQSVKTE
ncbi:MAG: polysaccharide deacetylase family protein [Pseudomonadota bacterium]